MAGIPLGHRFSPEDEELVSHFLLKKLNGGLSPEEAYWVPECDLYGQEEPWVMFEKMKTPFSGGDVFMFTQLKYKDKGRKKIDRRVGGGCWHGEDRGKEIAINGQIKAKKKRFSYHDKDSDHNSGWILHEYSLPNCPIVLCRLRNNSSDFNPELESSDGTKLDFDFFESLNTAQNVEGSHKRRRMEFENPTVAQPELMSKADSPTENIELSDGAALEFNNGSVKRRRLEFNNSCDNYTAAQPELESKNEGESNADLDGNNVSTADFEMWKTELQNLELDNLGQDWEFETLIGGSSSYDFDFDFDKLLYEFDR